MAREERRGKIRAKLRTAITGEESGENGKRAEYRSRSRKRKRAEEKFEEDTFRISDPRKGGYGKKTPKGYRGGEKGIGRGHLPRAAPDLKTKKNESQQLFKMKTSYVKGLRGGRGVWGERCSETQEEWSDVLSHGPESQGESKDGRGSKVTEARRRRSRHENRLGHKASGDLSRVGWRKVGHAVPVK